MGVPQTLQEPPLEMSEPPAQAALHSATPWAKVAPLAGSLGQRRHLLQGKTVDFYRTCALLGFYFHLVLGRNLRGRQFIVNKKKKLISQRRLHLERSHDFLLSPEGTQVLNLSQVLSAKWTRGPSSTQG